jgi:hypothetical protein
MAWIAKMMRSLSENICPAKTITFGMDQSRNIGGPIQGYRLSELEAIYMALVARKHELQRNLIITL